MHVTILLLLSILDGLNILLQDKCLTITKGKGGHETGVVTKQDRLQGVVEAEIATTIGDDTNTRDDEASVQADKTIRFEGLPVHINETVELSLLAGMGLGIISKTCSVDKRSISLLLINSNGNR